MPRARASAITVRAARHSGAPALRSGERCHRGGRIGVEQPARTFERAAVSACGRSAASRSARALLGDDPRDARPRRPPRARRARSRRDRDRRAMPAQPAAHQLARRVAVRADELAGLEPPEIVGELAARSDSDRRARAPSPCRRSRRGRAARRARARRAARRSRRSPARAPSSVAVPLVRRARPASR